MPPLVTAANVRESCMVDHILLSAKILRTRLGYIMQDDDDVGRPAVDPMLVSKYHLRREDDEIRDANMPERLFVEVQNDAIPHFHADDAAAYVYNALLGPNAQWCIAKVRSLQRTVCSPRDASCLPSVSCPSCLRFLATRFLIFDAKVRNFL